MPPPHGIVVEDAALERGARGGKGIDASQVGRLRERLAGADVRLGDVPNASAGSVELAVHGFDRRPGEVLANPVLECTAIDRQGLRHGV